ncbi:MAG TPA: DNA topoisomerase IV subunit B [Gammaproteobacteria bacterium]|nr:DNA topoisomerase IV subunit B [Gammaproteobacteria bacterium]
MSYTVQSIEVLEGLDPVKKRPGMYTDTRNPNHLAMEAIDNSVDEALAGHADEINVTLFEDGSIQVRDNGRGMPTGIHSEHGLSGVELILTRLHAGAKFSNKEYSFSGGLHGVGISVVNALSDKLNVNICQASQLWSMSFEKGIPVTPLEAISSVPKRQTGTMVRFWPTVSYFDSPAFSMQELKQQLHAKAVLCQGLKITLNVDSKDEHYEWCYHSGLQGYLKSLLLETECILEEPFCGEYSGDGSQLDWAVNWCEALSKPVFESYVNLIPTVGGGTHVNGFRTGIFEGVREFCEIHSLLPRNLKLKADDCWEGAQFVVSLKMINPQFSGQTKERLSSRQATMLVAGAVKDRISLWLNQNVSLGKKLVELMIQAAQRRLKQQQKIERKRVVQGPALPGKLTDCSSKALQETELFLVEGDSAGGSAKQARDRETQAILPLRGKILNTWEVSSDQVLASSEVHDIAVAIGMDPGSDDLSGLRYGKICILADADSDGAHIGTLICALFLRHFTSLVEKGHVYAAVPPLYRIDVGKEVFYALDDLEKASILERIHAKRSNAVINVQRFKGLGEMNPDQLRETAMAASTRRLVQLTLEDDALAKECFDKLMAKKKVAERRSWLEIEGDLADIDLESS